jgi:hypothetical protein
MIGAGWVSGSCLNEADIIRELQRRHLNYAIGKTIGARQRFYAFRTEGHGPHTLITHDLGELATELARTSAQDLDHRGRTTSPAVDSQA